MSKKEQLLQKGIMKVGLKTENGVTLTEEKGFTIEEDSGKVLAFDVAEHPDLGISLLFGNQVFVLKFWDDEDLKKGLRIFSQAIEQEIERRSNACS